MISNFVIVSLSLYWLGAENKEQVSQVRMTMPFTPQSHEPLTITSGLSPDDAQLHVLDLDAN